MDNDIYTAPQAELVDPSSENNALASRWKRLWASMLDGLIMSTVTMPVMYFTGGFDGISKGIEPSFEYSLMIAGLGIAIFIIINIKLLVNNGQTIGKKVLGIKIVDLEGNLPGLKKHLFKRYAVYFLPGQVPFGGPIFSMINILFIFGKEKRCIHDLVAETKVIMA
jgi:uncharacterized RDD family membrane protein YckC